MADPKDTKTNYSIEVTLSAAALKSIDLAVQEDIPLSQKLGGVATSLMADLTSGGLLIPPNVKVLLESLTGPLDEAKQLIPFIEKAVNMDDGYPAAKWRVDPTYLPYWQGVAEANRITVQQVIQNLCDWFVDQGWLNGSQIPGSEEMIRIRLTPEQYRELNETLATEHVTGSSILSYVREQAATATPVFQG